MEVLLIENWNVIWLFIYDVNVPTEQFFKDSIFKRIEQKKVLKLQIFYCLDLKFGMRFKI